MKISKSYFLSLSIVCISITSAFAMNPCEKEGPLETSEEAKECLEYRIKNDTGLYSLAEQSGHLGNMDDCSSAGTKSYFSKDKELFEQAINSIEIRSCQNDNRHPETYRCVGTTHGPACFGQGKALTKNIAAGIGKNTKKITTLHPVKP